MNTRISAALEYLNSLINDDDIEYPEAIWQTSEEYRLSDREYDLLVTAYDQQN
jgi:hypothetical protein